MSAEPAALLDELADQLVARGLAEQGDFYITGRFPHQVPSSEHIGMRHRDGRYVVWYRDLGESRILEECADFATARDRFVGEAVKLARERGRQVSDV